MQQEDSRQKVVEQLLHSMHRFKHHLRKQGTHDAMDITHAQWLVLMLLHKEPPASQSHYAKELGVSLPALSQMMAQMQESGWIIKKHDGQDKRRASISLTNEGRALLKKLKKIRIQQVATLLEVLEDDELATFAHLFHKISTSLDTTTHEE